MLRRVCVRGEALPALCGASLKGKGLEPLLDAMIAFLPSPLDRPKPGKDRNTVIYGHRSSVARPQ